MQRQRINNHTQLFLGQPSSFPALQVKSKRDSVARNFMLTPPSVYDTTNFQRTAPKSYHLPVDRHRYPMHTHPENRGHTRYIRGSSLYNQAVSRQMQDLARLIQM